MLTPALPFTTISRADPAGAVVTGAAGAALARRRWRRPLGETVVATLCASYVNAGNLGIPVAAYVLAATVTAALPTAQNVYVFAARYERAEPLARNVVLLSTLVAAGTTTVLAAWLG